MNIILIISLLLWLIIGYCTVRMMYYGAIRQWWRIFREDYRKHNDGQNSLRILLFISPVLIAGGLFSLLMSLSDSNRCWYFKIPK